LSQAQIYSQKQKMDNAKMSLSLFA
jgi:hypothetical protein